MQKLCQTRMLFLNAYVHIPKCFSLSYSYVNLLKIKASLWENFSSMRYFQFSFVVFLSLRQTIQKHWTSSSKNLEFWRDFAFWNTANVFIKSTQEINGFEKISGWARAKWAHKFSLFQWATSSQNALKNCQVPTFKNVFFVSCCSYWHDFSGLHSTSMEVIRLPISNLKNYAGHILYLWSFSSSLSPIFTFWMNFTRWNHTPSQLMLCCLKQASLL